MSSTSGPRVPLRAGSSSDEAPSGLLSVYDSLVIGFLGTIGRVAGARVTERRTSYGFNEVQVCVAGGARLVRRAVSPSCCRKRERRANAREGSVPKRQQAHRSLPPPFSLESLFADAVLAAELVYAAAGIHYFLLTGVKGMASRADFDVQVVV